MWQSRAWKTGKPGMSYINENSFSRWIIEKSDGLQKLSETVRGYMYLILTSQTNTRGPIIGHKEDKNSIPQCIGQSHITTTFSNMAPFPSRTRVRQTCADVQLKQSNFMTSTENVNKLCLFVQETEHLQVKLTMMVCPERISNVYNFTDVGFILIQHSGSMS